MHPFRVGQVRLFHSITRFLDIPTVVVRALTGKSAMAATMPNGIPSDLTGRIDGALEELQKLDASSLAFGK